MKQLNGKKKRKKNLYWKHWKPQKEKVYLNEKYNRIYKETKTISTHVQNVEQKDKKVWRARNAAAQVEFKLN